MTACTQAAIVPPETWEDGCLSIVVDARVQLLANAALAVLGTIPAALLARVSQAQLSVFDLSNSAWESYQGRRAVNTHAGPQSIPLTANS
mgnify:CR=1 FL=1